MDNLMTELLADSPVAIAVIIISVLWFRHSKARDKEWSETTRLMNDAQLRRNESCAETVQENTKVMARVEKLLDVIIEKIGGQINVP